MPIYEYRCEQGHKFEVMQRMSDDPVMSCETCASPVQRVFHPVAVHFKGKGFYNTDYGTKKRARELKESGGDGTGSQSKSDGSSKSGDSGSGSGSGAGSGGSSTAKTETSSSKASSSSD